MVVTGGKESRTYGVLLETGQIYPPLDNHNHILIIWDWVYSYRHFGYGAFKYPTSFLHSVSHLDFTHSLTPRVCPFLTGPSQLQRAPRIRICRSLQLKNQNALLVRISGKLTSKLTLYKICTYTQPSTVLGEILYECSMNDCTNFQENTTKDILVIQVGIDSGNV